MAINHTIRHKDGGTVEIKNMTRNDAIRLMCTECMGWESLPKDCTSQFCPLFPYRGRKLASVLTKKTESILNVKSGLQEEEATNE